MMRTGDRWYNNSVVYAVDVERFNDSNADGVGDFEFTLGPYGYRWLLSTAGGPDVADSQE